MASAMDEAPGSEWPARVGRWAAATAGLWYAATWAAYLAGRSPGSGILLGMGAAGVLGLAACLLLHGHAERLASPAALRLALCVAILAAGVGGLNGAILGQQHAFYAYWGPRMEPPLDGPYSEMQSCALTMLPPCVDAGIASDRQGTGPCFYVLPCLKPRT